jgi:hypothetical protein
MNNPEVSFGGVKAKLTPYPLIIARSVPVRSIG